MDGIGRRWGWVLALVVVLASVTVGLIGYNIGISHGLAEGAGADADFSWRHRPWGFGFMFPLLFFFLWFGLFHALWWGRGGPWRRRYYYRDEFGPHPTSPDAPDPWQRRFEEMHRRAHEHMKEAPSADDPGRRG